jgi:hypothetical protein
MSWTRPLTAARRREVGRSILVELERNHTK